MVELAVGNGRVAIRCEGDREERCRHRSLSGDACPARERAADAGVDLDLQQGDMRELELEEPAALVYCPFRSLRHMPSWARPAGGSSSGSWPRCEPGGRFAWNAFVFDRDDRGARTDGKWGRARRDQASRSTTRRPTTGSTSPSRSRRQGLALVGDGAASGKGCSMSRGSRPRRSTATSSARPSARRAGSSCGWRANPDRPEPVRHDRRAYDPWSRSVKEDVGFYVKEGARRAGRSSSSGSGRAGSRFRSPGRGFG